MDLEAGLYHDEPEFDDIIDKLSNELFQISVTNGQVSELLRRHRKTSPQSADKNDAIDKAMRLVQRNQQQFRQLKVDIEDMQYWQEPSTAQKYSRHKIAGDFGRLFAEFKRLQEMVIEQARTTPIQQESSQSCNTAIELGEGGKVDNDIAEEDASTPTQTLAFEERLAQDEVSYQQGLVNEREEEIENVAQGMNELNEIYMNLGTIVREQGDVLDSIESNLNSMATNVHSGSDQLTKAHRYQRRNSGRMCCFLIILLVMALFVVLAVTI